MTNETIRVLVVEDDEAHAELVMSSFDDQRSSFDVVIKNDLNSAKEQIASIVPDVVIADLNLPDGRGSDLIPANGDKLAYPIILMTSFGNEELAVEAMKLGVMDYVVKSEHTFETLPHIAERAFGEWRAIRQKKEAVEQSSRLAAAIIAAGESIMITEPHGTISYVNPFFEKMTGYSSKEVIGRRPSILSSGVQDEKFYTDLWEVISSGDTWKGFFVNKKKDGTLFEEEAVISPVRNEDGEIMNYVAVKRDVTEERMLEKQIRQSQKMAAIGQLSHKVAHDFTNVLSVIISCTEMAKTEITNHPQACGFLDDVLKASHRVAKLTSELLSFAHPADLTLKSMRLDRVVKSAEDMFRKTLPVHIEKVFEYEEIPFKVKVDSSQIEQALMHIAINAAEAMPTNGTLTISTGFDVDEVSSQRSACITISDTGCGMGEEVLQHIFEPFFSTKTDQGNEGLGLSTVYRIVEQHAGSISFDSSPGEGTKVRMSIPEND